ncbi:MAG: hypothetical protein WBG48_01510 [Pricia sp.]
MKISLPSPKYITSIVLSLFSISVIAQEPELQEYIDDMKSLLSNVEANNRTYKQSISSPSVGKVEITVNEINDKGGETEVKYALALSDINPRALRSFTSRDIKLVEIVTKGNQKLIKKTWDGGNKIAYISDFILYALDDDNGVDLKQAFEESVPFALEIEQKALSLKTYDDHLNWLIEHIDPVQLSDEKVEQQLRAAADIGDAVQLEQAKGSQRTVSAFNLSQLNANSIEFHVSGDEIFIEVRTKSGIKSIKYSVDGRLKDYRDIITIYANSPDTLKKIQSVLKEAISLAEKQFKGGNQEFTSASEVLEQINQDIKLVNTVDARIKQHMALNDETVNLSIEEISDKRHLEHEYMFSLTDINASGIRNETTKSGLFLELIVKNKEPFIKHIMNGEPQNYRHYVRLYLDSREDALRTEAALKNMVLEVQQQKDDARSNSRTTLKEAWANLERQVTDVENSERDYAQKLEMQDIETSALTYTKTVTDRRNTTEFVYEFGAKEMNPYTMEVQVSGNRVWVELLTKNKKKAIKLTENGDLQNYQYALDIEAASIANAKDIVATLKKLQELYDARIGR